MYVNVSLWAIESRPLYPFVIQEEMHHASEEIVPVGDFLIFGGDVDCSADRTCRLAQ